MVHVKRADAKGEYERGARGDTQREALATTASKCDSVYCEYEITVHMSNHDSTRSFRFSATIRYPR